MFYCNGRSFRGVSGTKSAEILFSSLWCLCFILAFCAQATEWLYSQGAIGSWWEGQGTLGSEVLHPCALGVQHWNLNNWQGSFIALLVNWGQHPVKFQDLISHMPFMKGEGSTVGVSRYFPFAASFVLNFDMVSSTYFFGWYPTLPACLVILVVVLSVSGER